MAVRLGTQNWINPAPFAAAAEMVVDAGRAQGAGVAALGSGIGQGLQAYGAKQEREQRRQDILAQQSIENARASRAEDRAVKQSKIAVLEASLTASKMNVEMARQQYEALGTPESEAAYMKAVQDAQGTMNLYRMGVANHGEPDGQTTDYLGVGGATGPGGWPVGQSPSEKAARGEPTGDSSVYWNAKDYAESDAAMSSSGVVAPSARLSMQPSMEAAAELVTASDFLRAARDARNEAARIRASGKNRRTEALAQVKENDAAYLEANAQMKANDEKSAREERERASREPPETVELGTPSKIRAERDKVLDATRYAMSLGYDGAVFPNIEAANAWIKDRQITDPNAAAAATRKADAARVRAENQQKLVDYRLQASKALADHVASIKEPAARAKAMQTAIENQQKLVKELRTKYEMLKSLQGKGQIGENDPDLVGAPGKPSAYDQYEAENDLLTEMVKQSLNVSAPTASVAPKPWANDPDFLKLTPEQKAAFEARMSGR